MKGCTYFASIFIFINTRDLMKITNFNSFVSSMKFFYHITIKKEFQEKKNYLYLYSLKNWLIFFFFTNFFLANI